MFMGILLIKNRPHPEYSPYPSHRMGLVNGTATACLH